MFLPSPQRFGFPTSGDSFFRPGNRLALRHVVAEAWRQFHLLILSANSEVTDGSHFFFFLLMPSMYDEAPPGKFGKFRSRVCQRKSELPPLFRTDALTLPLKTRHLLWNSSLPIPFAWTFLTPREGIDDPARKAQREMSPY